MKASNMMSGRFTWESAPQPVRDAAVRNMRHMAESTAVSTATARDIRDWVRHFQAGDPSYQACALEDRKLKVHQFRIVRV